ncbi:DUF1853 family protein [Trinickia terrae]|uniref:DUF1853 family protein n=1 Tax=Trinickia terrae TaxID=2571161 RepID=A0A4U1HMY0_9BURK|nr:DUF1853 family protein [Trinickia terrae]TKC82669.1 DUF1853 family protein [Trinickia terrae]
MKALEPAANAAAALGALLDSLVDPAVRDLAWLLFSPDLLRAQPPAGMLASPFESAGEASSTVAWLLHLDQDARDLHENLAVAHVTRLGRYAECLLGYFLRYGPAARLVAANVALRRAGRTIGECDFLVETAGGRRLHWELAVKCYLRAGGASVSMADYVGPNLQDRFDLKFTHLLDHQLPLSAREEFASLGHEGPWDAQMFVKGWLFYRWCDEAQVSEAVLPIPAEIHPAHARGWWLAREDFPRVAAGHAQAWAVLPRLAWLAPRHRVPVDCATAGHLLGSDALVEQLAQQSGPTMVAAFERDDGAQWFERSRGFVVPNDWPARALAFAGQ